jgi:hypothetical protein
MQGHLEGIIESRELRELRACYARSGIAIINVGVRGRGGVVCGTMQGCAWWELG